MPSEFSALDLIEELRLRRWARLNYVPREQRLASWDPVVLDEMEHKDAEDFEYNSNTVNTSGIVPLPETRILRLDGSHLANKSPSAALSPNEPAEFHFA